LINVVDANALTVGVDLISIKGSHEVDSTHPNAFLPTSIAFQVGSSS